MSGMHGFVGHPDATQSVAYTGTPATSNATGSQTRRIRMVATTAALVSFGNVVNMYLAPNVPEQFLIQPNTVITVSQVSAAGSLCLTEIV